MMFYEFRLSKNHIFIVKFGLTLPTKLPFVVLLQDLRFACVAV